MYIWFFYQNMVKDIKLNDLSKKLRFTFKTINDGMTNLEKMV